MTIALSGVLPLSAVNVGLNASLGGLAVESAKLSADITGLNPALTAEASVAFGFPPDPSKYSLAVASLDPVSLAAALNPTTWVSLTSDASITTAAKLTFVSGQLSILSDLTAILDTGLGAGSLWGWSYSGGAAQYGRSLRAATQSGFGRVSPTAHIDATIIACESLTSWQALGQSVYTGRGSPGLDYLGELRADQWNRGVADLRGRLGLLKLELEGLKTSLGTSLEVAAGLHPPDPTALFDLGVSIFADFGIDGLLDNLINVRSDITGQIGDITTELDAVVSLRSSISAQLAAGGFAVWKYSGPARELGSSFEPLIASGVPSGSGASATCYGLIIGGSGSAMSAFGSIFI